MNPPPSPQFDYALPSAEKRFSTLNLDRLRRVQESLSVRQRDFLETLPLLFHLNHALLPGYVSKDTPFGLADYSPSNTALQAMKRVSRGFELDRRAAPRFALRGLYMMGSPGTVSYSRTSDLDFWLIHDSDLSVEAVRQLQEKAVLLERFGESFGLEVHFFVFDAERFKRGETLSLSAESSGSSQHSVLLDEFYRSSLLVAGLPPLWWRVPSCYDAQYEDYVDDAHKRRVFDATDYIDFGGMPTIPVEEFFGAAVWQLYKSIESPYKAVLKLLLMEAYAADYPDIGLLCSRFKKNIESQRVELNAIDPYILMYSKVEEYLMATNDPVRLDVLRRSFYLKTNVRVSEPRPPDEVEWRREVMQKLVKAWDWSQGKVLLLDGRDNWKLNTAVDERRDLTRTLKESYANLSAFARNHASEIKITARDLHILGRKLYAAFDRKPSKIEVITRGITQNPREATLSLHEVTAESGTSVWLLFSGSVTPAELGRQKPIKRSSSAAEIILWCRLNRIADLNTSWQVFPGASSLSRGEIRRVYETLGETLAKDDGAATVDPLSTHSRITKVLLLVNVGENPHTGAHGDGDVLTSDHSDPYQFGGRGLNLVQTVDLHLATSWNETFAFHYTGDAALVEAIVECLAWPADQQEMGLLPTSSAHSFSGVHARSITTRTEDIFRQALRHLRRPESDVAPHYILETKTHLHHLRIESGKPVLESHKSLAQLHHCLEQIPSERFNDVRFDAGCSRALMLATLYAQNRRGRIQIYAVPRGEQADVYIIDERGVLLMQRQECYSVAALLGHYRSFIAAAIRRCQHLGNQQDDLLSVEVDTLQAELIGSRVKITDGARLEQPSGGYMPLTVLADADSAGKPNFTVVMNDREFSTWEYGSTLFQVVAQYVVAQRRSGSTYPIYITEFDLSNRFHQLSGGNALRPHDLLSYKKRIETQLTKALHADYSDTVLPVGL